MDRFIGIFETKLGPPKDGEVKAVKTLPSFVEKRVLVTGASSGIGRAVATWFLNEGAYVALIGRDLDSLNELGKQFPSQALAVQCDLCMDISQHDMCSAVLKYLGGRKNEIDILINCAGVIFDGDVENTYPQDHDFIVDINLRTAFNLTNLLIPFIEKAKGCIVNVSSCFGSRAQAGTVSYCMSKAGVEMLTKCCALELAPNGVRVNAVAPGTTDTNFLRYAGYTEGDYESFKSRVAPHIPLQRIATPDEIAKAIIFLCSEKAKNITGHILTVDGGRGLTTSGYVKWEGHELMNRRFEASAPSFFSYYAKKISEVFIDPIRGAPQGSHEWLKEKQTSNWATHLEEAHIKVSQGYAKLEADDDPLKKIEKEEDAPKTRLAEKIDPLEKERMAKIFGKKK